MKTGLRIALSIYVGFFVYECMLLLWGDAGIFAYRDIMQHKSELERNVAELEAIGEELREKRNMLLSEADEIVLRARSIGYFKPNEVRIFTPNQSDASLHRTLGRMIKSYNAKGTEDAFFRLIGCIVAVSLYVLLTFVGYGNSRRK